MNSRYRFISDRPTTQNAASNLQFGSLFAAESATKDTNLALSHTRVLGPTQLNEMNQNGSLPRMVNQIPSFSTYRRTSA